MRLQHQTVWCHCCNLARMRTRSFFDMFSVAEMIERFRLGLGGKTEMKSTKELSAVKIQRGFG